MSSESRAPRSWRLAFWAVCAVLVAVEFQMLASVDATPFTIQGNNDYTIYSTHDAGVTIEHSFLMRGDSLSTVAVYLDASEVVDANIDWTLWRGHREEREKMTPAAKETASIRLYRGRQWIRFEVPRDTSSHDRWYTFEMFVRGGVPNHPDLRVGVVASSDNPDRGGALWVDGARKSGSLFLRAERQGRSLGRRFESEIEPNLPPILRQPVAQAAIVLLFHWALVMAGLALLDDAWAAAQARRET